MSLSIFILHSIIFHNSIPTRDPKAVARNSTEFVSFDITITNTLQSYICIKCIRYIPCIKLSLSGLNFNCVLSVSVNFFYMASFMVLLNMSHCSCRLNIRPAKIILTFLYKLKVDDSILEITRNVPNK